MAIAITLHLLSAVIWVGGMFFAYVALRPTAATVLEPAQRLPLWRGSFTRFFRWVWLTVIVLPITGYWAAFEIWGTMAAFPLYIHLMQGLGIIMILVYMHAYFAPFKRLCQALDNGDLPAAGTRLNQIRQLVLVNLCLGLAVVAIATTGRYGLF